MAEKERFHQALYDAVEAVIIAAGGEPDQAEVQQQVNATLEDEEVGAFLEAVYDLAYQNGYEEAYFGSLEVE